ncbi:MAG TPA: hypothetical protein DHV14_14680 [Micrococcales bacterium]|nr:hypothetical protein [Micrococcales bacterium]
MGFSMLAASILLTVGLNLWSVPVAFTVAVRFFIVVLGAYYLVRRRARPTPRREPEPAVLTSTRRRADPYAR